ncbi:MAG: AraC family transcriptional regulator [Candidatus Izemoplasmatales bacterium]|nr:AraC family transcriptional regulator [Candidatus Izemoplasmatales bacterium]
MDWLVRMNRVLDYIEAHLTDTIDYDEIQHISCASGDFFQRMFSQFTGISLGEYIRRRKLSDAAIRLIDQKMSIIDLALEYGYESSDAFTHAFKKLHGVTPSDAKKKAISLTAYPKLSFNITMKGSERMKYRIVEREAFNVVGKSIKTSQERNLKFHEIPKFWDDFNQSGHTETLCALSAEENVLGVCYDGMADGSFSYMIGVVSNQATSEFETISIPKATWAVFESVGPMPDAIQKVWSDIFQNFLPTSGYEHAPMADFELYPKGCIHDVDYYSEVWIPIVKKLE